jgi:hypothetical protein
VLDPIAVPPVETVYQFIVFPDDVALRLEEPPHVTVEGDAVTLVGTAMLLTVTVTEVLVRLAHAL